jgi:hypothetical protein
LFLAADHARKTDPTLAARHQRLMCQTGRHHTSALCTIATVLLTRIVACLRTNALYQLRDVDGSPITPAQGRAIVAARYQIPPEVRAEAVKPGETSFGYLVCMSASGVG